MNDSLEDLRETLATLQQDNEQLRQFGSQANRLLEVLERLLELAPEDDPFPTVFDALARVFAYSHVLVLTEANADTAPPAAPAIATGAASSANATNAADTATGPAHAGDTSHPVSQPTLLECVAARPAGLVGQYWPNGEFFRKVADGRVAATFSNRDLPEWQRYGRHAVPLSPDQPALYLPARIRRQRGVLMMLRPAGDAGFDRQHVALARRFALLASHALAVRFEQELARRAYHDDLTGLANRLLLQQRVEAAIARQSAAPDTGFALAIIDLDRFKQINDYYSPSVGDQVLARVAQRMTRLIRPCDTLGRISSDEFVLLIDPLDADDSLYGMLKQIARELQRPIVIDAHEIFTSASIGVSLFPMHGDSYELLRRNADNAMFRAKAATKGGVLVFDTAMGDAFAARMALEHKLRHAIRERQFICALQPKVDIRSGRVESFEALVRWRDDDGTVHGPGQFIPLAIEIGLIDDITRFMLDEVLRALARLDACFGDHTTISINVSARQASDNGFMTSLAATLMRSRRAHRIMLELTEDAFIATHEFRVRTLPLLQNLGVGISIDDFGSGYSSLGALADIAADEIKIDRCFITNIAERPANQGILRAIESLCDSLGMTVVAEGVETAAELGYLLRHTGIRIAQGFHFARPMPLDALLAWQCPTDGLPADTTRAAN